MWDKLRVVTYDNAPEWDGHTSQDVAKRLEALLSPSEEKECTDVACTLNHNHKGIHWEEKECKCIARDNPEEGKE